jgi:hypothetical protein
MAIWEAFFTLVPGRPVPEKDTARLDAIAPRVPHWSASANVWGEVEGTRIELWPEDGEVREGTLRVDMRAPNEEFLHAAAAALREMGFELEDESGNRVPANPEALALALTRSRAARFLNDPEGYFRRVAVGGWKDA